MRSRLLLVSLLVASGSVVAGGGAEAIGPVRYATPTGGDSGDCLTPQTACSLVHAVAVATSGNEVVVAPGSYAIADADLVHPGPSVTGLNVHGTVGQRPVITTKQGLFFNGSGMRLADLTLIHTGVVDGLDLTGAGDTVERVEVHSGGTACSVRDGVIRDSLCVSTGSAASAVEDSGSDSITSTLLLRNVTAIATGNNSQGIHAEGTNRSVTIDARNVIASGVQDDVNAFRGGGGGAGVTISVVLASSNFVTVTGLVGAPVTQPGTGDNQTAPPIFADTVTYHEAAGSPTIDHGVRDGATGTSDLDGDARPQGSAADIGADEYPVPRPPQDTTPPDTRLVKTPKKKTTSTTATFTFTSEPGATFTCALDKKPAKRCSSPFKAKKLSPGKHRLTVTAIDAAGNADASPATYKWKVRRKPRHR